ncbi:MAG: ATP-binding cassette domain-containing protein [Candidatus Margulisiibacteriota bacterium]
MNLIELKKIQFKYVNSQAFTLKINQFELKKNTQAFIEGPSGCGKTTFLNLLTGLIKPQQGNIHLLGTDITTLSQIECDRFRADHFGIIFQLFNLIPYLSVIENIILPCTFSNKKAKRALQNESSLTAEAYRLCNELDIDDTLIKKPIQELSIGQQQRVAIARAIIGQPDILIADEPTSALDNERRDQFIQLLLQEANKYNMNLLFVSHAMSIKSKFNTILNLNELNDYYKDTQNVPI